MGTRSLTHIKDGDETILTIYRQFDGYPEGHGRELAEFLDGVPVVNGFTQEDAEAGAANGMGCLAAQLVAHLKEGIGNVYIMAPDTTDVGEEHVYTISEQDGYAVIQWQDVWNETTGERVTPGEFLAAL